MNNNVNRRMKIQITAIKMTSRIDRLVDVIYTSFFFKSTPNLTPAFKSANNSVKFSLQLRLIEICSTIFGRCHCLKTSGCCVMISVVVVFVAKSNIIKLINLMNYKINICTFNF